MQKSCYGNMWFSKANYSPSQYCHIINKAHPILVSFLARDIKKYVYYKEFYTNLLINLIWLSKVMRDYVLCSYNIIYPFLSAWLVFGYWFGFDAWFWWLVCSTLRKTFSHYFVYIVLVYLLSCCVIDYDSDILFNRIY